MSRGSRRNNRERTLFNRLTREQLYVSLHFTAYPLLKILGHALRQAHRCFMDVLPGIRPVWGLDLPQPTKLLNCQGGNMIGV